MAANKEEVVVAMQFGKCPRCGCPMRWSSKRAALTGYRFWQCSAFGLPEERDIGFKGHARCVFRFVRFVHNEE